MWDKHSGELKIFLADKPKNIGNTSRSYKHKDSLGERKAFSGLFLACIKESVGGEWVVSCLAQKHPKHPRLETPTPLNSNSEKRTKITSCHTVPPSLKTLEISSSAKAINRSAWQQRIDQAAKRAHPIWDGFRKPSGSWGSGDWSPHHCCCCYSCKNTFPLCLYFLRRAREIFRKVLKKLN